MKMSLFLEKKERKNNLDWLYESLFWSIILNSIFIHIKNEPNEPEIFRSSPIQTLKSFKKVAVKVL